MFLFYLFFTYIHTNNKKILFYSYNDIFSEMWIASAFKGATNNLELIPDSQLHYLNQESWLKTIRKNSIMSSKIRGIALTGWSRSIYFSILFSMILSILKFLCSFF